MDSARNVIPHVPADLADKKDNQCLPFWTACFPGCMGWDLAARPYWLMPATAREKITPCGSKLASPPHGTYKGGPACFTYHQEGYYWLCSRGRKETCRKVVSNKVETNKMKVYYTTRKDCKGYPYREGCMGKQHEKRVEVTYYRHEYERVITRLNSRWGRRMKRRQGTVELLLGTPVDFLGMRRVNTRGRELAHKGMLVAATAYNLQKLLRFTPKRSQVAIMALPRPELDAFFKVVLRGLKRSEIRSYC